YLGSVDLASIEQALAPGRGKMIQLSMSYRSTLEIATFARAIDRTPSESRPIERRGPKPLIVQVEPAELLAEAAVREIRRFHAGGIRRVAVICKTAAESQQAFAALRRHLPVQLVTAGDSALPAGDLVIPAYLAKGLEFDGVIIYDAGAHVYGDETERRLFYTACTRALHRLALLYTGELTPFLEGVGPSLADYERFSG
ncbi:MAG: ATP-binding domain-containing protein, partial [Clostridia bacterium]